MVKPKRWKSLSTSTSKLAPPETASLSLPPNDRCTVLKNNLPAFTPNQSRNTPLPASRTRNKLSVFRLSPRYTSITPGLLGLRHYKRLFASASSPARSFSHASTIHLCFGTRTMTFCVAKLPCMSFTDIVIVYTPPSARGDRSARSRT